MLSQKIPIDYDTFHHISVDELKQDKYTHGGTKISLTLDYFFQEGWKDGNMKTNSMENSIKKRVIKALLNDLGSEQIAYQDKFLAKNPSAFDPRKYLGPARTELIAMYEHKNKNMLGSAGKA